MIKSFIINHSIKMISDMNKYSQDELEQIKYGLEGIYVTITKVVVILLASAFLNIFKEALIFLILFNFLRVFAFGLHASKSIWCWISSSLSFLLIPFICKNITFPLVFFIISSCISLISFCLYAPADTIKRPLINARKRKRYKILSICLAMLYIILIFNINNNLFKNLLTFALILQTILILPITYKIFNLSYNNYKNYKE